jgi:hypothetical protein
MSYIRVLPRDLFNEANLLKCLGQLWLLLDGKDGSVKFVTEAVEDGFWIHQDPNDGSIYVANVEVSVRDRWARLSRPLNSRQPWPLYLSILEDPGFDPIAVFNDDGSLSDDMLRTMRGLQP